PTPTASSIMDLDILQNWWSLTYDVAVLMSIQSLLHGPNLNNPANTETVQLNVNDFVRLVKATVEDSWSDLEERQDTEK
ncbi:hypothetical protein OG21DRAFT_1368645, partial [Imleria badia]